MEPHHGGGLGSAGPKDAGQADNQAKKAYVRRIYLPDAAFFKDTFKKKSTEYGTCKLCGLAEVEMKVVRRQCHLIRCTEFQASVGKSFVEWAAEQKLQLSAEVLSVAEVVGRKRAAIADISCADRSRGEGGKRQRSDLLFSPVKSGGSSTFMSCGGQKLLLGKLSKETVHDFQMRWARYGPFRRLRFA